MSSRPASLATFVARRYAAPSPLPSWVLFERLGGALAYGLSSTRITPTAVTMAGGTIGVVGALQLALAATPLQATVAGLLLLTSYTFDCADGQLARATGQTSDRGAWFDVMTDGVVIAFVTAALTVSLTKGGIHPVWCLSLAGAYGASRTANLLMSSRVRADGGGLRLRGMAQTARAAYVALIDTPVIYLVFGLTILSPAALSWSVGLFALLTLGQVAVSARAHFATAEPAPTT